MGKGKGIPNSVVEQGCTHAKISVVKLIVKTNLTSKMSKDPSKHDVLRNFSEGQEIKQPQDEVIDQIPN